MSTTTAETITYEGFPYLTLRRDLLAANFTLDSDLGVHDGDRQVGYIKLSTRDCDVHVQADTKLDKFMKKKKKIKI